jgi:serine/threonine-protein kinase
MDPDDTARDLGSQATVASAEPAVGATPGERYQLGAMLGRGGMGEVLTATDAQIGRQVAIKRMRIAATPELVARFWREARIQGRLDHPAIVPVHELATDRDGRPYFVMKKLTGTTLQDILAARDAERWPRQALLRAYCDVCLAVEFAHTRGVIHRDLKPANIMLGDFGEVYVLDWGVARVAADDLESLTPAPMTAPSGEDTLETQAGTLMGTPAYMSPEQARGELVDARTDVFALGKILDEILGDDGAPELAAVSDAATADDRERRTATARELGAEVQRFLDGDRDLALRKQLAAAHLATARAALDRGRGVDERRVAMFEAGRALALVPSDPEAAGLVGRLMLEPPPETPAEVEAVLEEHDRLTMRSQTRLGVFAFCGYLAMLPLLIWQGVDDMRYIGAVAALACMNITIALYVVHGPLRHPIPLFYASAIGNAVIVALFARIATPYLIAPGIAGASLMGYAFHPRYGSRLILWFVLACAVLVPAALENAGVLSRSMTYVDGTLVLDSPALDFAVPRSELVMAIYVLMLLGVCGMIARGNGVQQREARRTVELTTWHLRQLIAPAPVRDTR